MSQVLHLKLTEPQRGAWQLRFWTDNENTATPRPLDIAEIKELVEQAETYYYAHKPDLAIGKRLYRWLDGPDRVLSQAIQAGSYQSGPLILAIDTAKGLAHLPWETLADESGFLVARQNPPVVPTRWRSVAAPAWPTPKNRPLHTLFMAAAPEEGGASLDFEAEEGRMFQAAEVQEKRLMELTVEESGCLTDLADLMRWNEAGYFDIFHLTGHAGFRGTDPIFMLETDTGTPAPATAADLTRAFTGRVPPAVFLSGCSTAQNPGRGEEQSMAELLVGNGVRAVLGWGRPVRDDHATQAAAILYRALTAGDTLPAALAQTYQGMLQAGDASWHLLRLYYAGTAPGALVTAPSTKNRERATLRLPSERFLIPNDTRTKVPGPAEFVGRRRLLQECLRHLRDSDCAGVALYGTGGLGKSSVAGRLCDRLQSRYHIVTVFGECSEYALTNALAVPLLGNAAACEALQGQVGLVHRLINALDTCDKPVLFVLDDFEQNQEGPAADDPGRLKPERVPVVQALMQAIAHNADARLLLTTRYAVPPTLFPRVTAISLTPMEPVEETKRLARLHQKHPDAATKPEALRERARAVAAGNHLLLGWLYEVLNESGLDHAALIERLEKKEAAFRIDVMAEQLCIALPIPARNLLTALQACRQPVPLKAVQALSGGQSEAEVSRNLAQVVAWGLAYVWKGEEESDLYLAAPFLVPVLGEPPIEAATAALAALRTAWWDGVGGISEARSLELHRLALKVGENAFAGEVAGVVCDRWMNDHRSRETVELAELTLDAGIRDPRMLTALARAYYVLGDGAKAAALHEEVAQSHQEGGLDLQKAAALYHRAENLLGRGQVDEAQEIFVNQLLPFFRDNDEFHSLAVTQGQIADILVYRGELDEALRIRREEELPVYERLGDVRSVAVTQGKIADILFHRGELDEALRIRREEQLPVFEKLGDARERAITQGKIADILVYRGELDEALRIRREEELPVFEKLGDVREVIICRAMIAQFLAMRGRESDIQEIVNNLAWAWRQAQTLRLPEAQQIEQLAAQMGIPAELLAHMAEQRV